MSEPLTESPLLIALIRVMLRCCKTFITLMGKELEERGMKA